MPGNLTLNLPDAPFEAPFEAPWQAQLFALTVALNQAGCFSWAEWTAVFGPNVTDKDPQMYWQVWSDALIALLEAKDITKIADIHMIAQRWKNAAQNTPHGQPVHL